MSRSYVCLRLASPFTEKQGVRVGEFRIKRRRVSLSMVLASQTSWESQWMQPAPPKTSLHPSTVRVAPGEWGASGNLIEVPLVKVDVAWRRRLGNGKNWTKYLCCMTIKSSKTRIRWTAIDNRKLNYKIFLKPQSLVIKSAESLLSFRSAVIEEQERDKTSKWAPKIG